MIIASSLTINDCSLAEKKMKRRKILRLNESISFHLQFSEVGLTQCPAPLFQYECCIIWFVRATKSSFFMYYKGWEIRTSIFRSSIVCGPQNAWETLKKFESFTTSALSKTCQRISSLLNSDNWWAKLSNSNNILKWKCFPQCHQR